MPIAGIKINRNKKVGCLQKRDDHWQWKKNMIPNILSFIEALLVCVWAVGYFGFGARGFIHILVIIAILIIAIRIVLHKMIV